jgi:hypothetical protein
MRKEMRYFRDESDFSDAYVLGKMDEYSLVTVAVWSNGVYTFVLTRDYDGFCHVAVRHNDSKKIVDNFPMGDDNVTRAAEMMAAIYGEAA